MNNYIQIFTFISGIFLFYLHIVNGRDTCGSIGSVTLYCPSGYHCCDTSLASCCLNGYVCTGGTSCVSVAAFVVPAVIFVIVVIVIIVICVKKKSNPGTVMHRGPVPAQPVYGQPAQQGYGQPQQPPYGQPQQPPYGQSPPYPSQP